MKVLLATFLMTAPALAQEIDPPVLLEPVRTEIPGRTVDVLGLTPGITAVAARPLLAAALEAEPEERLERDVSWDGAVRVDGPLFVKSLYGEKSGDRIAATFSGVSSGNQLYLVKRDAAYANAAMAPDFDGFVSTLTAKYGTASFVQEDYAGTVFYWMYKDGALVDCDPWGRPQCLTPDAALSNLSQYAVTFDVVVAAMAGRAMMDETRLQTFSIGVADLAVKSAADIADEEGLREALESAVARSRADAVAPAL